MLLFRNKKDILTTKTIPLQKNRFSRFKEKIGFRNIIYQLNCTYNKFSFFNFKT